MKVYQNDRSECVGGYIQKRKGKRGGGGGEERKEEGKRRGKKRGRKVGIHGGGNGIEEVSRNRSEYR